MSPIPKRKLCWQCEGNVDFDEDNCPYCGVYLHLENSEDAEEERAVEEHRFEPPYKIPLEQENSAEMPQEARPALVSFIKPLLFLLLGSTLLIFGFVLLLFNHHGVFTLQWNADIWYVYLLVALPLLWGGWNSLQGADSNDL